MSDETVHYMESTVRLRAENEELRERLKDWEAFKRRYQVAPDDPTRTVAEAAEATMREVAEELRRRNSKGWEKPNVHLEALADRLDPS